MNTPELFDAARYPRLLKASNLKTIGRRRATLLSVGETSDGFLIGQAYFEEGDYTHSVFLGKVADFV